MTLIWHRPGVVVVELTPAEADDLADFINEYGAESEAAYHDSTRLAERAALARGDRCDRCDRPLGVVDVEHPVGPCAACADEEFEKDRWDEYQRQIDPRPSLAELRYEEQNYLDGMEFP